MAQFGASLKKELIQEGIRKNKRQSVQVRAPVEGDNRRKKVFFCSSYIKYWYWFIPLTLITH